MDEIKIRRELLANPQSDDADVKQAISTDESLAHFAEELKDFDQLLTKAMKVPVAEDLTDRIILSTSIGVRQSKRRKQWQHLAIAASIALVSVVGWNIYPADDPARYALEHTHHEFDHLVAQNVSLTQQTVNERLAAYGVSFDKANWQVKQAENCFFQGVKSFHLTVATDFGPLSIYIVPTAFKDDLPADYADERFVGKAQRLDNTSMFYVADNEQALAIYDNQLAPRFKSISI